MAKKKKNSSKGKKIGTHLKLEHFTYHNPTVMYLMVGITIISLTIVVSLYYVSKIMMKVGGFIAIFVMLYALLKSIEVTKKQKGEIYSAYSVSNTLLAILLLIIVGLLLMV